MSTMPVSHFSLSLDTLSSYQKGLRIKERVSDPLLKNLFRFSDWLDHNVAAVNKRLNDPIASGIYIEDLTHLFDYHRSSTASFYVPVFTQLGDLECYPCINWVSLLQTWHINRDEGIYYANKEIIQQKKERGYITLTKESVEQLFRLLQQCPLMVWQTKEHCVSKAKMAVQILANVGVAFDKMTLEWCFSENMLKHGWIFHVAVCIKDHENKQWIVDPTVATSPLTREEWLKIITTEEKDQAQTISSIMPVVLDKDKTDVYILNAPPSLLIELSIKKTYLLLSDYSKAESFIYTDLALDKIQHVVSRHFLFRELFQPYLDCRPKARRFLAITKLYYSAEKRCYAITPTDISVLLGPKENSGEQIEDSKILAEQVDQSFAREDFISMLENYICDMESQLPPEMHKALKDSFDKVV